mgnify:CR=1 FL=1
MSHYETNLDKNDANYVPLTPLTFLKRAYEIYPNYEAVIYEDRKYTWSQVYKRTVKFASALNKIGVTMVTPILLSALANFTVRL